MNTDVSSSIDTAAYNIYNNVINALIKGSEALPLRNAYVYETLDIPEWGLRHVDNKAIFLIEQYLRDTFKKGYHYESQPSHP